MSFVKNIAQNVGSQKHFCQNYCITLTVEKGGPKIRAASAIF
jgi:hypothetical protein